MDSKNTKATEHFFTGSKFRPLALASGIVAASAASKSILGKSQLAGFEAEQHVFRYMMKNGWLPTFSRVKTAVAEIDLVFEKKSTILLLEVKTLNDSWRAFERISLAQTRRLQKNTILFSEYFLAYEFKAGVVWVSPQGQINFVEIG